MAAVLSNRGGFYTPAAYIGEARRMGLTILKPDVNESRYSYWGSNHSLRIGLVEVKGLRKETAEQILREREKKKFTNIEEFANRVELIGEDTEALVSAGAFDSLSRGLSRPEQLWVLLKAASRSNGVNKEPDLFGALPVLPKRPRRIPTLSPEERRKGEFQRLGYLLDGHILTLWEPFPEEFRRIRGANLSSFLNQRVQLIGWPVTGKEVLTREGNPMEFVSFEDETAIFETVLFPQAYRRLAYLLDTPSPFLIKGIVQEDMGAVAIHVEELKPLQHLYSL
jgi:DNA polymerase-3 subunit alpha/error-prone DNA polymerase